MGLEDGSGRQNAGSVFLENTMHRSPGTGKIELVLDSSDSPCRYFPLCLMIRCSNNAGMPTRTGSLARSSWVSIRSQDRFDGFEPIAVRFFRRYCTSRLSLLQFVSSS
jgi:hypothetical protein